MAQSIWGRAVLAGLVASIVMGMWQMVAEAITGEGLFGPPVYIAATVLRDLQQAQGGAGLGPVEPIGIVAGLMGHMMNSVLLALAFAAVAPRLTRSIAGLVALGMVWGLAVYAVMWLLIVPLVDPVLGRLHSGVFLLGHLMWGATLAGILAWRPVVRLAHASAN